MKGIKRKNYSLDEAKVKKLRRLLKTPQRYRSSP